MKNTLIFFFFSAIFLIAAVSSVSIPSKHKLKPVKDRDTLSPVNITLDADDSIQDTLLSFFQQASVFNASHVYGRIFLVKTSYDEGASLNIFDGALTKTYDLCIDVNTVRAGYNPTITTESGIDVSLSPGSVIRFSGFAINLRLTQESSAITIESAISVYIDQLIFNAVPQAVQLSEPLSSLTATNCKFNGRMNGTSFMFAVAITAASSTQVSLYSCTLSSYHNQSPAIRTLQNTTVTIVDSLISDNVWDNGNRNDSQMATDTSPLIEIGMGSFLNISGSEINENSGWWPIIQVGKNSAVNLQNSSFANNTAMFDFPVVQVTNSTSLPVPIGMLRDELYPPVYIDSKYQAKIAGCEFYNPDSEFEIMLNKTTNVLITESTFYSSNFGVLVDTPNGEVDVDRCIFMSSTPFKVFNGDPKLLQVGKSVLYSDLFDPLACSLNSPDDSICTACSGGFECHECQGVCVRSFSHKKPSVCYQKGISSCNEDCVISSTKNTTCTCGIVLHPLKCGPLHRAAIVPIVFCVLFAVGLIAGILMTSLDKRSKDRRSRFINN